MSEVEEQFPAPVPASVDEIIADLQGFGIEEFEEILTIESGPRAVRIRISNISTDDDIEALLAVEDRKGYDFFQRVKGEILSHAISWINGVNVRQLTGAARIVTHPRSGERVDIRIAIRDTLMSWGSEVRQVLWKILMVHSQNIENRLFESFPDAAIMTGIEQRYITRINNELEEAQRDLIQSGMKDILDTPAEDGANEKVTP